MVAEIELVFALCVGSINRLSHDGVLNCAFLGLDAVIKKHRLDQSVLGCSTLH